MHIIAYRSGFNNLTCFSSRLMKSSEFPPQYSVKHTKGYVIINILDFLLKENILDL